MSVEHYLLNDLPTICEVFSAAAADTWERIGFSRSTRGMKCHETALTQNLVYEMRLLKDKYSHLDYDLYESTNEKANGNDLLFRIFHSSGKIYTYAIQAKIIYHTITSKKKLKLNDGWYVQLKHMVSKTKAHAEPQVDKLLKFSKKNGFIPMYLLYNYVDKDYCGTINRSHGCTVVGAQSVKDNFTDKVDGDLRNDVKFTDLHTSLAFPWQDLVCILPHQSKSDHLDKVGLPADYNLKELREEDFKPGSGWLQLVKSDEVNEFVIPRNGPAKRDRNEITEQYDGGFNPKYMFSIGFEGSQDFR